MSTQYCFTYGTRASPSSLFTAVLLSDFKVVLASLGKWYSAKHFNNFPLGAVISVSVFFFISAMDSMRLGVPHPIKLTGTFNLLFKDGRWIYVSLFVARCHLLSLSLGAFLRVVLFCEFKCLRDHAIDGDGNVVASNIWCPSTILKPRAAFLRFCSTISSTSLYHNVWENATQADKSVYIIMLSF